MESAGESAELTIALAQIFAGEIDFNTELQPGDRFSLTFERFVREDGPATYGTISAAEFENEGRLVRAIRFTPPGGMPDYFDEQGRSLRRFFLRSPLKFEPRDHLAIFDAAHAPGAPDGARSPRGGLRRTNRRTRRGGCGRQRRVGDV